jgi:uncharacterized protein (TIGR03083 family)
MIPERDVDCGAIYERTRGDFVALMRSCTDQELAVKVPATPEWLVRDVLSHVTGITADLNAQHFGTDAESWTAAQVWSRRNRSVDEVVDEWDREAPQFEDGLRIFGYELGSHYVGDLLQHLGDVLHALGRSRPVDDDALAVALDFYLISFEQTLRDGATGAVRVCDGRHSWTLGSGEVVAAVTSTPYELFRSLGGRRSDAQIRALDWTGDLDAIVPILSRYPLPSGSIIESS